MTSLTRSSSAGPGVSAAGGYGAVIFDMDGVVTDTAQTHAKAWKTLFDEALPVLEGPEAAGFDVEHDYRAFVDGRSREDGIRTFLVQRGISVPEGGSSDAPGTLSVAGMAERKQQIFTQMLVEQPPLVFPDALALLHRLFEAMVPTALVTASRNCRAILAAAGISGLFTLLVDGTDAVDMDLPGKPEPAMFLEAARRLQVQPADAIVLEDAASGIRAGIAGGFALVVGVDRGSSTGELLAAGAHLVVKDLTTILLLWTRSQTVPKGTREERMDSPEFPAGNDQDWLLAYDGFDPQQEGRREALCALANGHWATRGSFPGAVADGVHYPGTYFAGVYNRAVTELAGRGDEAEHMVNAPDWTFLTVRTAAGLVLAPGRAELLSHRQELDLRHGVLTRTSRFRDTDGRTTRIASRQFQSLAHPHLAVLETTVEAEDWAGDVEVVSAVNGAVVNSNCAADSHLNGDHLLAVGGRVVDEETVLWESRTKQSSISIAVALRTTFHTDSGERITARRQPLLAAGRAGCLVSLSLEAGRPVTVVKTAATATSRDRAVSTAALGAVQRIQQAPPSTLHLRNHMCAWDELWARFGVQLGAGRAQRLAMNLNTFHVLQTVAAAEPDLDAGAPARGLHGEGYRGHIFWDELFVYPMLTLRRPEITKWLLLYRYRRLESARAAARTEGRRGAKFPWRSGSDGREETPVALFNVRDQQWMPDNSRLQVHGGLAVAYNIWQYFQASGDADFLAKYGAEILVEVSRYFASLATLDQADGRYDITAVMGPDEFHDGYPGHPGEGLRNNAYTNVLASWVMAKAVEAVELVTASDGGALCRRLSLAPWEPAGWESMGRRLRVPFHADGVISQFEGYADLQEFGWDTYRSRYGDIARLDLILQAEGDSTNGYKLSKQADVLMLFYLFSAEELREVFERLGYPLPPDVVPRTIRYYLSRTSHGSTLSRLAHSWVLARSDREQSWGLFTQALECDLEDTQGGTTREGVHLGAMAGTSDMVLRCYGGVETRNDTLWLHPLLPSELPRAAFHLSFRGQVIAVTLTLDSISLCLEPGNARPIHVNIENVQQTLGPGDTMYLSLETKQSTVVRRPPASS